MASQLQSTQLQSTHFTGAGITIGILSDSFDVQGGYAADIADGALPSGISVLEEGGAGGQDEGRAMAELIHRIAPDAKIVFTTAFNGEADFAAGIGDLVQAGANVIVDDVTYLDEPFFQAGGAVGDAVAHAVASGVSYFTAAGNEGDTYYQASFRPMQTTLPSLGGHYQAENFGTAAHPQALQALTIAPGSSISLDLQWDQPFASIGTGHAAANSLGMVLFDADDQIVGYAMRNAVGGDPDQILQFTNDTDDSAFRLAIVTDGGSTAPGTFKYIGYGSGLQIDDASAGIGSGTLVGHAMAAGVDAVGAATPDAAAAEDFSSQGQGTELFDATGARLAVPAAAGDVAFLAPDGAATSVFDPFYGTSAAAPVAAATAALMLQADPALTPAQVSAILAQSALPATGPVAATGAGLIQAGLAVQRAAAVPQVAAPASAVAAPVAATSTVAAVLAAPDGAGLGPVLAALRADPSSAADFAVSIDPAAALRVASVAAPGAAFAVLHTVDAMVVPVPGSAW